MDENPFDGETIVPERDNPRLSDQMEDILKVVLDGNWYTLSELHTITGHPEASISARLRDLRKKKWGNWTVERRYIQNGLHAYRLV